jgi:hypothetical protein
VSEVPISAMMINARRLKHPRPLREISYSRLHRRRGSIIPANLRAASTTLRRLDGRRDAGISPRLLGQPLRKLGPNGSLGATRCFFRASATKLERMPNRLLAVRAPIGRPYGLRLSWPWRPVGKPAGADNGQIHQADAWKVKNSVGAGKRQSSRKQ